MAAPWGCFNLCFNLLHWEKCLLTPDKMLPSATSANVQKTGFLQSWLQITDLPEEKMTLDLISVYNSLAYVSPWSFLHRVMQKQGEEFGLAKARKERKQHLTHYRVCPNWWFPSNRRLQPCLEFKCHDNNHSKSCHIFHVKGWGFGKSFACLFVFSVYFNFKMLL